jgi:hypothetical protein
VFPIAWRVSTSLSLRGSGIISKNFLKPGLKLLAILLRGKEKETFRLTTRRIEKAKKDMIEQQT